MIYEKIDRFHFSISGPTSKNGSITIETGTDKSYHVCEVHRDRIMNFCKNYMGSFPILLVVYNQEDCEICQKTR